MEWTEAGKSEFLEARAADGAWLVDTYGLTPAPPRSARRDTARERGADEYSTLGDDSVAVDVDVLTDDWHGNRKRGTASIFRELRELTRLADDCERLDRAQRGVGVVLDWDHAFAGRTSLTVEELRRLTARGIISALRQEVPDRGRPRSDDIDAMWRSFPVVQAVHRDDCWWCTPGALDPSTPDPRLPPPERRGRTLQAGGLFELHCRLCRRHERSADGWIDEEAHWSCDIHQQLFSLCSLRLPFLPDSRPSQRIIRAQVLESDPELAALADQAVEAEISLGAMVYARRDEPLVVVPSRVIAKWSLRLSAEEEAAFGARARFTDVREILRFARLRAKAVVADAIVRTRDSATPFGKAFDMALRASCGTPKIRLVSCHNLGVNDLNGDAGLRPQERAVFFFSTFTASLLQQITAFLGTDGFSIYYLDDNGAVCRAERVVPLQSELMAMSALAGYEYAGAKYQAGLSAKCLGRTFDVESDELSIAPEKIFRTLVLLQSAVELIDATTAADAPAGIDAVDGRFVESLTGTLGWLAECSYAGLLHMGAFYYAAKVVARSSVTRLSRISGFRAACSWWLDRAASGRLRGHKRVPLTSIPSLRFALDTTFNLEARAMLARGAALTDAHNVAMVVQGRRVDGGSVRCLQVDAGRDAWAVILDGVAFWGRWLPAQRDWSSGGREFYSPLQIFLRRPELLRDAFVIIGFDNASDALAVCLGRARAAVERRLLTALFEASHDLGVQLAAWWCSRRLNARADELSKCTSPADARRWAGAHGLQLVACDDVRDDYVVGSLASQAAPASQLLTPQAVAEAASHLRQLLPTRANPPPPMTYQDLHAAKGTPPAARAALAAARSTASWRAVAAAFQAADTEHRLAASASEWRSYVATCEADGAEPLPLSIVSVLAWWHHRVVGNHLKSSALPSVTSRLLSYVALQGMPVSRTLADGIWLELRRFRAAFPCEVAPAAPPLGDAGDGRLSAALAFAESRASTSLLYRVLHTLLVVSQALYCRPTALLDGNLHRDHILSVPASPVAPGGLVLRLLLPKREKTKVDMRRDSFPIPTGPATRALLALLGALGLLEDDAQTDAIVFPDIDPRRDCIRGPALSVERATDLLRRHVFIPAGLPAGNRLTLRSIRSGASTDAAARGISSSDRLAQGGWASEAGAKTYLDRGIMMLAGPTPRPS